MDFRQIFSLVTSLLSGLILFLSGMNTMSDSLSDMAGGKLEHLISKLTASRYSGYLFGLGITAVVQSSSAVSVLTVGLVNSGIMELQKSAGILIGANLGTTATAWLLSMNALSGSSFLMEMCKPSSFSPFLGMAGIIMLMFAKKSRTRNIASALTGFTVMMIGMNLMGAAVAPLKNIPALQNTLLSFTNPFTGFMFSLLFTMLIQSSDASVGMLQAFSLSVGVTFGMALPLICGAQVGTCITSLISSLNASRNGKRTALIQLYYNLLKVIPMLVIFYTLNNVFRFGFLGLDVGAAGIPLVHSMINVIGSVVYLPVSGFIVRLAELTLPYTQKEMEQKEDTLTILDPKLLLNPSFALQQAEKSIKLMASTVQEAFTLLTGNEESGKIKALCSRVSKYNAQISAYLGDIMKAGVQDEDMSLFMLSQKCCLAFGRMGELITEQLGTEHSVSNLEHSFSKAALSELYVLRQAVGEAVDFTIMGYNAGDKDFALTVSIFREEVSQLHRKISARHLARLHSGQCDKELSPYFMDLCYGLEKIIDACDIIAGEMSDSDESISVSYEERRSHIAELFRDKYTALQENA